MLVWMWSVCLHITDSQHPQRQWAWSRAWAAHQWQQQQSGTIIRQLGQWKDLTAGALLREIMVKCQGVWLNPSFIICWFFSFFLILLNGLVKIRFLSVKEVNLQQLSAIVIISFQLGFFIVGVTKMAQDFVGVYMLPILCEPEDLWS